MGLFGGKKKSSKTATTDYVDMEAQGQLPVAVAVEPVPEPKTPIPANTVTKPTPASSYSGTQQQLVFASRTPVVVSCPHCHSHNVRTRTRTAPHILTWLAVLILVFVFWPICWIPLVIDGARRTTHYCSNCNAELGSMGAFQDCCVKHR